MPDRWEEGRKEVEERGLGGVDRDRRESEVTKEEYG